ncbi:antifreeze protein [Mesobaculum littorinae]|uniref:Antifreeze protein n=2 Tax=Mesobaculum littorinae TaxID=2486419 RepID=A0A438AN37_9RHOB|nr:antifreeze protein [Mesobaculum littorinae]
MATMMAEAQMVVGLRCLGLAGVWAVAPGETQRMVSEKAPVFAQAGQDAWAKALSGARPDEVMAAWLRPISRKTHANSVRLAKRGPKFR